MLTVCVLIIHASLCIHVSQKTIEVEANSQPLMAQLMQLANQHAAAQAAAAAAAANKKDTDKPPAGQAQPGTWHPTVIATCISGHGQDASSLQQ